jgi:hypothetical protein
MHAHTRVIYACIQVQAASDLSALASLIPATSRLILDPGAPPGEVIGKVQPGDMP